MHLYWAKRWENPLYIEFQVYLCPRYKILDILTFVVLWNSIMGVKWKRGVSEAVVQHTASTDFSVLALAASCRTSRRLVMLTKESNATLLLLSPSYFTCLHGICALSKRLNAPWSSKCHDVFTSLRNRSDIIGVQSRMDMDSVLDRVLPKNTRQIEIKLHFTFISGCQGRLRWQMFGCLLARIQRAMLLHGTYMALFHSIGDHKFLRRSSLSNGAACIFRNIKIFGITATWHKTEESTLTKNTKILFRLTVTRRNVYMKLLWTQEIEPIGCHIDDARDCINGRERRKTCKPRNHLREAYTRDLPKVRCGCNAGYFQILVIGHSLVFVR